MENLWNLKVFLNTAKCVNISCLFLGIPCKQLKWREKIIFLNRYQCFSGAFHWRYPCSSLQLYSGVHLCCSWPNQAFVTLIISTWIHDTWSLWVRTVWVTPNSGVKLVPRLSVLLSYLWVGGGSPHNNLPFSQKALKTKKSESCKITKNEGFNRLTYDKSSCLSRWYSCQKVNHFSKLCFLA